MLALGLRGVLGGPAPSPTSALTAGPLGLAGLGLSPAAQAPRSMTASLRLSLAAALGTVCCK